MTMELKTIMEDISRDIEAATKVLFETMIMLDLKFVDASLTAGTFFKSEVASFVSFMGKYHGLVGVFCTRKFATQIASSMLMSEFQEFTAEIIDAIGEVSNMIAGNVKTKITADYGEMMLSIPMVIIGGEPTSAVITGNLPISCFTKDPWLVTNFTSGNESFVIGLLLKETK